MRVYAVLVALALVVATARLAGSTEMPGLAAIELVLLALPWSLALQVEPLSRLPLGGMAALVLAGVLLNATALALAASRWSSTRGRERLRRPAGSEP